MTKIGAVFQFEAPSGWTEIREGSRHIFHGPNREELIVSVSLIQGIGTTRDLRVVQQRFFQNAEQSVKNAVAHPALKVTQPFQRDASASKIECWTLLAQTLDGGMVFYQKVFHDPRGILLATFEGPNTANGTNAFEQFAKSVAVISDSEALVE